MGCLSSKEASTSGRRVSLSLTYDTDGQSLSSSLLEAQYSSPSSYSRQDDDNISRPSSKSFSSSSRDAVPVSDTNAVLIAANYCKDSPFSWQDESLPNIGGRSRKWHFCVEGEDSEAVLSGKSKRKMVPMVMVLTYLKGEFPIPLSNSQTLEVFASLVCGMENAYISPCEDADYIRERFCLLVTRKWSSSGSLRDLIYGKQRPKNPFSQKYVRTNAKPLPIASIQNFGRHILEAMSVLNAKGIVVDCLTPGNVLIFNKIARISDLENTLLGGGATAEYVEMLMRHTALAAEAGSTACPFDVLLFGLVLLEMASGAPILASSFEMEVDDCFSQRNFSSSSADKEGVTSVLRMLESIFVSHDATVKSLLSDSFFSSVTLPVPSQKLKLSKAEKGLVKSAMKASSETRNDVLTRIQREREAEENERQQRLREFEETAVADSIADSSADQAHSRRLSVLKRQSQSSIKSRKSSSASVASTSTSPVTNHSSGIEIPQETHEKSETSLEAPSTDENNATAVTGLPEKYQKLLNVGLHAEQVKHKMTQDGLDPSTFEW